MSFFKSRSQAKTLEEMNKPMRSPHVYALMFGLIVICAILTWIIPAGAFDRQEVNGRMMVVADTYHQIEQSPVGIWGVLMSLPQGWADICKGIFMVFFVGAALKIMEKTNALNTTLQRMVVAFRGKEVVGLTVICFVFSLLGMADSLGMAVVAIVPLCVVIAEAMGFDALVGFAMSYIAYHIGFSSGEINIFTTSIAQGLADIPQFSGMGVRILLHALLFISFMYFLIKYGRSVQKDKSNALVPKSTFAIELSEEKVTTRHILIIVGFVATFVIMVYGAVKFGWSYQEFSALFLAFSIYAGFVGGLGVNNTATYFVEGCANVAYGALVIGVARSISIVLANGNIMDTIVFYLSKPIAAFGPVIGAVLMFLANIIINIFIPSGSGQAAAVMPLMIPLADVTGISRHVAIIAFQMGDGLNNFIIPTAAMMMASIGMIGLPYNKYLKWAMPIFVVHCIIAAVVIAVLQIIGWC